MSYFNRAKSGQKSGQIISTDKRLSKLTGRKEFLICWGKYKLPTKSEAVKNNIVASLKREGTKNIKIITKHY
jgi:hypothetical protein